MKIWCEHCRILFNKRPADIKRTNGNFCSRRCSGLSRGKINAAMFFKKAKKLKSGCWQWKGSSNKDGYGTTRYMGKSIMAHRLSFLLHGGEIPDGMCVLHSCDNPPCVNPDHLFLGTHQDNMDDMARKGRRYYKRLDESVLPIPRTEK